MTIPNPVIDLIEAFRRSKTMFAAVALGIFDSLASGAASKDRLAAQVNANPEALERLLDACVGLGLLRKHEGQYANEAVAQEYLCRASSRSLTGYILYSNDVLFRLWGNLEHAVRDGTHQWQRTFGLEGPIFNHFFQTDDSMRTFLMGMHGLGLLGSPAVVSAFELQRFRRLVDLGGATGHLAIAACEMYPDLQSTVFDLPRATALAREQVSLSPARDRIAILAGDFFTDDLPEGDLFALGRILHDWSEDKIHSLLNKIFERLPSGGAVLIAEKLLDPDKTGPVHVHMQSLNMLLCTEGKERTLGEYEALLRSAGFSDIQGRRTGAPVDAIMATKA